MNRLKALLICPGIYGQTKFWIQRCRCPKKPDSFQVNRLLNRMQCSSVVTLCQKCIQILRKKINLIPFELFRSLFLIYFLMT